MNPQQQQQITATMGNLSLSNDASKQHSNDQYRQKILDALYVCTRAHTRARVSEQQQRIQRDPSYRQVDIHAEEADILLRSMGTQDYKQGIRSLLHMIRSGVWPRACVCVHACTDVPTPKHPPQQ